MNRKLISGFLLSSTLLVVAATALADTRSFALQAVGGALSEGGDTITVNQDDSVSLSLVSDKALIVHLHGYDLEYALQAGTPLQIDLPSHLTGRFPAEIHHYDGGHGKGVLFYYEVYPK
ncbi:hypothetical protein [Limibacillus halophilus]|uniref:DUF3244 domain-containing protein n=1 Tax=Limibacillus halophilus TaxID=1579333 RepID=A0A839SUN7_9PROT|nr:hypothetical protein [Limibacillus halophilus]MBB3066038.1 hypothetical protein [Limibacillus halophilus]